MMANEAKNLDPLFEEHSYEEIEQVRDNLADEIEKKTNQLKSIVKQNYRDIVEASDVIKNVKSKLISIEESMKSFDSQITAFFSAVNPLNQVTHSNPIHDENPSNNNLTPNITLDTAIDKYHQIWDCFDARDWRGSLISLNDCEATLNGLHDETDEVNKLKISVSRAKEIIKAKLSLTIEEARPNQIGILVPDPIGDFFLFSTTIEATIESSSKKLSKSLLSMDSIIKDNELQYYTTEKDNIYPGYTNSCPNTISIPLSTYLFNISKAMNIIAGYKLDSNSISTSLRTTLLACQSVYSNLLNDSTLKSLDDIKYKALQFYFDMLFLKLLLSHSKDIQLMEELEPKLSQLAENFKQLVDPIEFSLISQQLHSDVLACYQTTKRVYGLITTGSA